MRLLPRTGTCREPARTPDRARARALHAAPRDGAGLRVQAELFGDGEVGDVLADLFLNLVESRYFCRVRAIIVLDVLSSNSSSVIAPSRARTATHTKTRKLPARRSPAFPLAY